MDTLSSKAEGKSLSDITSIYRVNSRIIPVEFTSNRRKYLVKNYAHRSDLVKITTVLLFAGIVLSTIPVLTYAQQQTNFVANLSGKNVTPPVNTPASGTAKFQINPNGTLSYQVDAMNLNKVIGAHIGSKNGTELAQLLDPYATVSTGFNQVKSVYPTGLVNGKLGSGVITSDKLLGPLTGKNVTDLTNAIKHGGVYVVVRTQPNQQGEIAGQILPSK
jgi:CHRD domain-containing protein